MAQNEKSCQDSLLKVLEKKPIDVVRYEIDNIKDINKKVFVKRQFAIVRRKTQKKQ